MKPNTSITSFLFMASVMTITVTNLHSAECKTVQLKSQISAEDRKLENFVDFTEEGDQLSLESTRTATDEEESTGSKRGILGKKSSESSSSTGRDCANVQSAVLPVIPVIIASLVGLIGAIIISAIVRLVFRKTSDKDSEHSEYGYDRRVGKKTFFGFDLTNMNFVNLAKTVLSAVEKVY